jgi:hypothetical protein
MSANVDTSRFGRRCGPSLDSKDRLHCHSATAKIIRLAALKGEHTQRDKPRIPQ